MERKNRMVFVLSIALVIVAAVLASFGSLLFSGGTPRVTLPDLSKPITGGAPAGDDIGGKRFVPVSVTADTVQSVIATLERPASYTRTITLDSFSGETRYSATADVQVDGAWTQVVLTQQTQPRGAQHTIAGSETVYRWYGSDRTAVSAPADSRDADLAQRIPSYQDILDLDKKQITDTAYEEKNGIPCIFVEVAVDELGYRERYWVSVSSGLLMASETVKNNALLLRMASSPPESPVPAGTKFSLPDGTVLHVAGSGEK